LSIGTRRKNLPLTACKGEPSQKVNGGVTSVSVVPTGLWVCGTSIPSDESLGYYRKSLRDKAFA